MKDRTQDGKTANERRRGVVFHTKPRCPACGSSDLRYCFGSHERAGKRHKHGICVSCGALITVIEG